MMFKKTFSNGKSRKGGMCIVTTRIPPSEFNQIIQTKSSPETIAALLNEAEERHSPTPKRSCIERMYPFWKVCHRCRRLFPAKDWPQATRNRYCSMECRAAQLSEDRTGVAKKPPAVCKQCGKEYRSHATGKRMGQALAKAKFCSQACYGLWRSQSQEIKDHMTRIAGLGRAGWTKESHRSYAAKMSGANNPAWKGGVIYFRKHGNYAPIKYVRCPEPFLSMARKDGYVMEHRLLVAQQLGRPLKRSEVVHHTNHNPQDNQLENLMLFSSNTAHKKYEGSGSPQPLWQL